MFYCVKEAQKGFMAMRTMDPRIHASPDYPREMPLRGVSNKQTWLLHAMKHCLAGSSSDSATCVVFCSKEGKFTEEQD